MATESDRLTWTEDDDRVAHREHTAWHLWREVLHPARYREIVPRPPAPLPPRPRPRQITPNPDDEEPSPVISQTGRDLTSLIKVARANRPARTAVYQSRRTLRGWVVVLLVVGAVYVAVEAIRGLR